MMYPNIDITYRLSSLTHYQLIRLSADHHSHAYVRCGTKMTFTDEQKHKIREFMKIRAETSDELLGSCIETLHDKAYFSKTRLSLLHRTRFRDLRLEMQNVNCYVYARILDTPHGCVNLSMAIEDEDGDVVVFELLNFYLSGDNLLNKMLIIKEPYFKLTTRLLPAIRCDSPFDVIILQTNHPLYNEAVTINWKNKPPPKKNSTNKTASEWLEAGIKLERVIDCVHCYLAGLKVCNEKDKIWIELNIRLCERCMYFLLFEDVVKYGENMLKKEANKVVLVLVSFSYFALGKYKESYKYSRKLYQIYGRSEIAKLIEDRYFEHLDVNKAFQIAIKRDEEARNRMPILNNIGKLVNCAESKSSAITVNESRQVISVARIKRNELLIVAKPLVHDPLCMGNSVNYFFTCLNNDKTNWVMLSGAVQKIHRNPLTYFRRIFELRSSTGYHEWDPQIMYCDGSLDEFTIDMDKLLEIISINNFNMHLDGKSAGTGSITCGENLGKGLYKLPSYIKHSCHPNSDFYFMQDVMVVITKREIKKNEEISIDYARYAPNFQRRELLDKRLVECDRKECPKCNSPQCP